MLVFALLVHVEYTISSAIINFLNKKNEKEVCAEAFLDLIRYAGKRGDDFIDKSQQGSDVRVM